MAINNESRDWDLYRAAKTGNLATLRRLLDGGADINTPCGSMGETPLITAAMWGHTKIIRLLLERGADVNAVTSKSIEAKEGNRYSALMYAARAGHMRIVRILLEAGADPTIALRNGKTAADLAHEHGFFGVVAMLKEYGIAPQTSPNDSLRQFYAVERAMADRIKAIDWFAHCGEPFLLPLGTSVEAVASWDTAKKLFSKHEWERTRLEAQNRLSGYLFDNHFSAYQSHWHPTAGMANGFFQTEIYPKFRLVEEERELDDSFTQMVRWDVTIAIIEYSYRDFDLPDTFFQQLLAVYEAGHLPCGWTGGKWPEGHLLVF